MNQKNSVVIHHAKPCRHYLAKLYTKGEKSCFHMVHNLPLIHIHVNGALSDIVGLLSQMPLHQPQLVVSPGLLISVLWSFSLP